MKIAVRMVKAFTGNEIDSTPASAMLRDARTHQAVNRPTPAQFSAVSGEKIPVRNNDQLFWCGLNQNDVHQAVQRESVTGII